MAQSTGSYVETIDLLEMFKGDTLTIPFEFWYDETNPIDLLEMGVEAIWTLCPYGQYDYPAIRKNMIISEQEHHVATVLLTLNDMIYLDHAIKYTQQPILKYTNGEGPREYRRAEGDLLIRPRINYDNING